MEQRGRVTEFYLQDNSKKRKNQMSKTKQFEISQTIVEEAFRRVKANKGAAGVDEQSIADFEESLEENLYKIWNRMSSGAYFPPPVKRVQIPKTGGVRYLGVPTVVDRVAQMVAKIYLEPELEPMFHEDTYGYRPQKSALDAVAKARERCFRAFWVLDLDIKAFFDNLDHKYLLEMVRRHAKQPWIVLYVERWLKAPVQLEDGTLESRDRGSPQGSVISPLLSNLYLHYAFDKWFAENSPKAKFERFADDIVVHCYSEKQAQYLIRMIKQRLAVMKLELNEEKTKIVFCKSQNRKGSYEHEKFDFLGYTFRPRPAFNEETEQEFLTFSPGISDKAAKSIRKRIRGWKINESSPKSIKELAALFNPVLQGWINYYGRFNPTEMFPIFRCFNGHLKRWAMKKYKSLRRAPKRAREWLWAISRREPSLFAHWKISGANTVR